MEQWAVPLLSAVAVVEWLAIVALRRGGSGPRTDGRLALLDIVVAIAAIGLLVSALQYQGLASGHASRVALGIVRVVLVVVGTDLLWQARRHRRVAAGGR